MPKKTKVTGPWQRIWMKKKGRESEGRDEGRTKRRKRKIKRRRKGKREMDANRETTMEKVK